MSLKDVVDPLVRDDEQGLTRYSRAIKLFEFEVALLYGTSFNRLIEGRRSARLKAARILAAGKIIANLELDLRSQQNVSKLSIRELAENQDYQIVFDGLFVPNGGWTQMVLSKSAASFDRDIRKRLIQAQAAANVIDFLHRSVKNQSQIKSTNCRKRVGLDAARYVVRQSYPPAISESLMKLRWREYSKAAVFLYLILNQKFDLTPPQVKSDQFAKILLRQADDRDQLRRFFSAYEAVRIALAAVRFEIPISELNPLYPHPHLNVHKLSPGMLGALSAWDLRK
jgi:hypothetical protein